MPNQKLSHWPSPFGIRRRRWRHQFGTIARVFRGPPKGRLAFRQVGRNANGTRYLAPGNLVAPAARCYPGTHLMLSQLLDVVLHLDIHLAAWSASLGSALYGVLFLVVFCETGLVVTPFLPGDSLLFAVGALSAVPGSGLDVVSVDGAPRGRGHRGRRGELQARTGLRCARIQRQVSAHQPASLGTRRGFYDRHGGKAIVLARFAPDLAHVRAVRGRARADAVRAVPRASMSRAASLWVTAFCVAGYIVSETFPQSNSGSTSSSSPSWWFR